MINVFVKKFSSIASHLNNLTKKEVPLGGIEKCEEIFQNLKTVLATAPILALPVEGKDFIVCCDASYSCLGVMLKQDKNFIAYSSCQFKMHERNYLTHDLELVAVCLLLIFGDITFMVFSVKILLIIAVCSIFLLKGI